MSLTLSVAQQAFLRDSNRLEDLVEWVLRANDHVASGVREETRVRVTYAPTSQEVDTVSRYLKHRAKPDVVVRLISSFQRCTHM